MRNPQQSLRHSQRRARRETRVQRALRKWREMGYNNAEMMLWARKNADHLRNCSCFLCCHNRRANGLTMQEKRSNLALTDEF